MIFICPEKIRWLKESSADPLQYYSDKISARIVKTHAKHLENEINVNIEPLTDEIRAWFTPLYTETIKEKLNPVIFDIHATTIDTPEKKYYALILTEHKVRLGAIIFSEPVGQLNITYKIFPNNWTTSSLPANPALYADYLISLHAYNIHKALISHGKDRNPYGMNSAIGLAVYKLSLGYLPSLPIEYSLKKVDTETLQQDTLAFFTNESTGLLNGALFTLPENETHWSRLISYSPKINLEVHYR